VFIHLSVFLGLVTSASVSLNGSGVCGMYTHPGAFAQNIHSMILRPGPWV
jgi:hypothetical protein